MYVGQTLRASRTSQFEREIKLFYFCKENATCKTSYLLKTALCFETLDLRRRENERSFLRTFSEKRTRAFYLNKLNANNVK